MEQRSGRSETPRGWWLKHLDDDGSLIWTNRLTTIVIGLAALLGGGALVVDRMASEGAAEIMGMVATVALIVAVGGRAWTARNRRWAGVEEPPLCRVRVRRGRVVIPRRDVAARVMLALLVVGCIAVIVMWAADDAVDQASIVIAAAFFGPLVILFALLSFASRVVVTPAELVVYTVYTRRAIPRTLVGRLQGTAQGQIRIQVQGGPEVGVPTGVSTIFIRGSWNYRPAELMTAGRIQAALAAVPAAPGGDRVMARRRPATIIASILAAATFATVPVLVGTGSVPTQ